MGYMLEIYLAPGRGGSAPPHASSSTPGCSVGPRGLEAEQIINKNIFFFFFKSKKWLAMDNYHYNILIIVVRM